MLHVLTTLSTVCISKSEMVVWKRLEFRAISISCNLYVSHMRVSCSEPELTDVMFYLNMFPPRICVGLCLFMFIFVSIHIFKLQKYMLL